MKVSGLSAAPNPGKFKRTIVQDSVKMSPEVGFVVQVIAGRLSGFHFNLLLCTLRTGNICRLLYILVLGNDRKYLRCLGVGSLHVE